MDIGVLSSNDADAVAAGTEMWLGESPSLPVLMRILTCLPLPDGLGRASKVHPTALGRIQVMEDFPGTPLALPQWEQQ